MTLKLLARNLNQTGSQVKRSKKGAKKATPEAAIGNDAENIHPNLPNEVALPAPDSKAPTKRTRKTLTKGVITNFTN